MKNGMIAIQAQHWDEGGGEGGWGDTRGQRKRKERKKGRREGRKVRKGKGKKKEGIQWAQVWIYKTVKFKRRYTMILLSNS